MSQLYNASNLTIQDEGVISLERSGTNGDEEASHFAMPRTLPVEQRSFEAHRISTGFYETILEKGRMVGSEKAMNVTDGLRHQRRLLPLASNDLRRPTRDGNNGGYSWVAANAAADMLGSPHESFDLNEVRLICKNGRQAARERLKRLQSAPGEVLKEIALVHRPDWAILPDIQPCISQLRPEDLQSLLTSISFANCGAIDRLNTWTWLEDLFDRIAAHGADPGGSNYNEEMKNQTVMGKALLMAIVMIRVTLDEAERTCADLWHAWMTPPEKHQDGNCAPSGDPDTCNIMHALAPLCNGVTTLAIPFALSLLQLEQEFQANPAYKSLIPPPLERAVYDLAAVVDLTNALNCLLHRRHHIFSAVIVEIEMEAFANHPLNRRAYAMGKYYVRVENERWGSIHIDKNAEAHMAAVWKTVQRECTKRYQCNLIDLFDLENPLERQLPRRRMCDYWVGDEFLRKTVAAKSPAPKAKTKSKVKTSKPGRPKERPALAPAPPSSSLETASHDDSSHPARVPTAHDLSPPAAPAPTPSGHRRTSQPPAPVPLAEHHSFPVESTPYAQSGHSYRKANGLLDKSTASNKTSRRKTNESVVERRPPPAVQEVPSEHPVYQGNNRQLKLMHVLLEEPEPGSGDGGEIRWEALVLVFKRIGFTVTANSGYEDLYNQNHGFLDSPDALDCRPRPKPVLEKTRVKELREKLQDLYGWNTDWFTSAGSRRDWEED